jgi:biopolymer transport protein ExbD
MAGGAIRGAASDDSIAGINVTPLVDITLVLLITFMVTTRIMINQTVPLDLPRPTGTSDVQVVLSIVLAADGQATVDSQPIANDEAILQLAGDAQARHSDLRAVVNADAAVTHGRVIHVLDLLKQARVSKITFGTSPVAAAPH